MIGARSFVPELQNWVIVVGKTSDPVTVVRSPKGLVNVVRSLNPCERRRR